MGFSEALFVKQECINIRTVCAICLDVLDHPVSTRCNHWFCKSCILASLNEKPACPYCRADVTPQSLERCELAEALINSLDVYCHEEPERRCAWTGPPRDLAQHLAACPAEREQKRIDTVADKQEVFLEDVETFEKVQLVQLPIRTLLKLCAQLGFRRGELREKQDIANAIASSLEERRCHRKKQLEAISELSLSAIKNVLRGRRVDFHHCIEKRELVLLVFSTSHLATAEETQHRATQDASTDSSVEDLKRMGVAELKSLIRQRGLDDSKAVEKNDLVNLLTHERPLQQTPERKQTPSQEAQPPSVPAPGPTAESQHTIHTSPEPDISLRSTTTFGLGAHSQGTCGVWQQEAEEKTGPKGAATLGLSTKELRSILRSRGVDMSGVIEKRELVSLVEATHGAPQESYEAAGEALDDFVNLIHQVTGDIAPVNTTRTSASQPQRTFPSPPVSAKPRDSHENSPGCCTPS